MQKSYSSNSLELQMCTIQTTNEMDESELQFLQLSAFFCWTMGVLLSILFTPRLSSLIWGGNEEGPDQVLFVLGPNSLSAGSGGFLFVFTIEGNKFLNQWKVSSDYITTEMVATGSSVKQPRNMESEKGKVEAASSGKKLLGSQQKWTKIQHQLALKMPGMDYTHLLSSLPKKYFVWAKLVDMYKHRWW